MKAYEIKELWRQFGAVPMNEKEEIEVPFLHWVAGTHREAIWHWFDDEYEWGVESLLYHGGNPYEEVTDVERER